jgi:hypothetical protein
MVYDNESVRLGIYRRDVFKGDTWRYSVDLRWDENPNHTKPILWFKEGYDEAKFGREIYQALIELFPKVKKVSVHPGVKEGREPVEELCTIVQGMNQINDLGLEIEVNEDLLELERKKIRM